MSYECNYSNYDPYDRPSVDEMLGDDFKKVEQDVHDFIHDLASMYLNTETWGDGEWEEWHDIVRECL